MSIEKLERDLAFISKLSDYPGSQDGLSTDEFKGKFDEAALIIQEYINTVLVPAIIAIDPSEDDDGIYLRLAGGKMKGPLSVLNPTDASHAVNQDFVEKYVASQKFYRDIVLTSAGWVGESAPFTQTIAVDGILESDRPHYGPVYSESAETALLEKENWAMVDDMTTADGSATFFCFEEKPVVDIAVQLEVHR